MGSLGWALIQMNGVPIKRGNLDPDYTEGRPGRRRPSTSQGERPRKKASLSTLRSQTSRLQSCEVIRVCVLNPLVCNTLLWQPYPTNTSFYFPTPIDDCFTHSLYSSSLLVLSHVLTFSWWPCFLFHQENISKNRKKHSQILITTPTHRYIWHIHRKNTEHLRPLHWVFPPLKCSSPRCLHG